MFKVAIGHSEDPDAADAVNEVLDQCRAQLGSHAPQAGIVFCAVDYDYAVILRGIRDAFPDLQLIGCSSGGELSSRRGYVEDTLLLALFASDTISMAAAVVRNMSSDITAAVDAALADARGRLKAEPVLCLTFPDIFTVGTVRLVEGLKRSLGALFPVLGGGASDPWQFDRTREFYGDEVLQDAAPLLLFAGPLDWACNVVSGWEPFTSQKRIMECNKNVVLKIGDMSALDYYKHYLGAPPTIAHPLAVFEDGQQRFYLRVPLQTDEKTGSVVLGGDLPRLAATSICQADSDHLIAETEKLLQPIVHEDAGGQPACALIISCSCRQKILGTRTQEEYRVLRKGVSPEVPLFGFYAYGQISPFNESGTSFVHNDSVAALLLKERHAERQ
jgi:hypothetical protein